MGKFLSSDAVIAAYKKLAHLTNNPDKQGQTQKASGLKYVVALSRFALEKKHDLNTKDKNDRSDFENYVGEVVSLDDGRATKNFYNEFTDASDYNIGSNFYSAGVIPDSIISEEKFPYPRRGHEPLFYVKGGKLLIESINAASVSAYLNNNEICMAFIVWISRNLELPEEATMFNIMDILKGLHCERYSAPLIDGLWENRKLDICDLGIEENAIFGTEKPTITRKTLNVGLEQRPKRTSARLTQPHNLIFFGAPGTGKSYQLNKLSQTAGFEEENIRRVTFYPDYTYSQFVGCFKPYAYESEDGNDLITYRFLFGPFLETYLSAISHPLQNHLLIVEEINRANPSATFGDMFQLLDRNSNGDSEYSIAIPIEMRDAIKRYWLTQGDLTFEEKNQVAEINGFADSQKMLESLTTKMRLPSNMYIWATMNSADQGVFPMDTAFKRRWSFRYMDINEESDIIANKTVRIAGKNVIWDKLRREINRLMTSRKINEDKLLGPFFISPDSLTAERFESAFSDKVLLYLCEDVDKLRQHRLFSDEAATYSELRSQFKVEGISIFQDIFISDVAAHEGADEPADRPRE